MLGVSSFEIELGLWWIFIQRSASLIILRNAVTVATQSDVAALWYHVISR